MKALHCGGISSLSRRDQEQQAGAGRAQQQEVVQTSPAPWEGFWGAVHFTPCTLGVSGWTRRSGYTMGKPRQQSLAPRSSAGKDGGVQGSLCPLLSIHQLKGCIEGLGVCKAGGGWNKMAAAKSSLKHPKLLMCMKPQQHRSRTPEGTKARAAPLSHSAGATCCSLNSARNVAGMKVALPARVLREPKSKDCQVKRVKPPRTAVSDWLYIISIASSTGIII